VIRMGIQIVGNRTPMDQTADVVGVGFGIAGEDASRQPRR